jgi:pimeloyl-ACP methyl ester carboxylesterase
MIREQMNTGTYQLNNPINPQGSKVFSISAGEGNLVYEDFGGNGPVVLCLPSLGDTRREYRFLIPKLKAAGFRVLSADLRGHGESDTTFTSYNVMDIVADISVILEHAGVEKVSLIGCSVSGGAIAAIAALKPEKIEKIVMISPFARDTEGSAKMILLGKILFSRPWGPTMWNIYYNLLYPQTKPSDFQDYLKLLKRNLSGKGRMEAVVKMFCGKKTEVSKLLPQIKQDALIIMGSKDIDFPKPNEEAEIISNSLGKKAAVKVLENLGHYPHAEAPELTGNIIIDFLKG